MILFTNTDISTNINTDMIFLADTDILESVSVKSIVLSLDELFRFIMKMFAFKLILPLPSVVDGNYSVCTLVIHPFYISNLSAKQT